MQYRIVVCGLSGSRNSPAGLLGDRSDGRSNLSLRLSQVWAVAATHTIEASGSGSDRIGQWPPSALPQLGEPSSCTPPAPVGVDSNSLWNLTGKETGTADAAIRCAWVLTRQPFAAPWAVRRSLRYAGGTTEVAGAAPRLVSPVICVEAVATWDSLAQILCNGGWFATEKRRLPVERSRVAFVVFRLPPKCRSLEFACRTQARHPETHRSYSRRRLRRRHSLCPSRPGRPSSIANARSPT